MMVETKKHLEGKLYQALSPCVSHCSLVCQHQAAHYMTEESVNLSVTEMETFPVSHDYQTIKQQRALELKNSIKMCI